MVLHSFFIVETASSARTSTPGQAYETQFSFNLHFSDEGTYFGLSEDLIDNTFAAKEGEDEGTYFGLNEEERAVRG